MRCVRLVKVSTMLRPAGAQRAAQVSPWARPATMSKRPTVAVPRGAMSTDQPDVTQRPGYGDATRCRPSWSDRGAVGEAGAIVGVATAVPIEAAARTAMTPDFSEVLMAYG